MKTHIEIRRYYNRNTKTYYEGNPIVVSPGLPSQYHPSGGLLLLGMSEIFYCPNGKPRIYIETDGPIEQIGAVTINTRTP